MYIAARHLEEACVCTRVHYATFVYVHESLHKYIHIIAVLFCGKRSVEVPVEQ